MHSICVWNMIEQGKPLRTIYDTTHISDRYLIRTHVYVFLFSVKKCVLELSRVWPWWWPCGGTPYMVYIGPAFHYTNKTCLKTVGYCGYEWVEKEMCRFAEDMSWQTHCILVANCKMCAPRDAKCHAHCTHTSHTALLHITFTCQDTCIDRWILHYQRR